MKLRNKKTGEIVEPLSSGPIDLYFYLNKYEENGVDRKTYNSLSELNDEWEDYEQKEPLIKDEKVRKAVRAWAEALDENTIIFDKFSQGFSFIDANVFSSINFDGYVFDLVDDKKYTIAELCGEEEEAERAVEYLKALAVVRGDATSKFIKGIDNWSVHYYAPHNCLDVADNSYCIRNGIFGLPYFATREDAKRSIEQHKNEWLTIFGVKEDDNEA